MINENAANTDMENNESGDQLDQLHSKAEELKGYTQEFVNMAQKLSDEGVKDAKKFMEFAKTNWKTILGAAVALGGAGAAAITTSKRTTKGKTTGKALTATAITSKAKTAVKKIAKATPVKAATSSKSNGRGNAKRTGRTASKKNSSSNARA